jgi:hypothetical protein
MLISFGCRAIVVVLSILLILLILLILGLFDPSTLLTRLILERLVCFDRIVLLQSRLDISGRRNYKSWMGCQVMMICWVGNG